MVKLIGWCAVVWAMFHFGVAQLVAVFTIAGLSIIAGV